MKELLQMPQFDNVLEKVVRILFQSGCKTNKCHVGNKVQWRLKQGIYHMVSAGNFLGAFVYW